MDVTLRTDLTLLAPGDTATLTWTATGTSTCQSSGGWTGGRAVRGTATVGPLTTRTTFTLTCTDPSSGVSSSGSVILDPASPLPPAPTTSVVHSDSGLTSLTYFKLNIATAVVVWDPVNGRLHALTKASSPTLPHAIVSIDPTTGQVTAQRTLASAGRVLAVSEDGRYLYAAGFRDGGFGGEIQRISARDLSADLTFSVGSNLYYIQQIAPSPVNSRTIAVSGEINPPAAFDGFLMLVDDNAPRSVGLGGDRTPGDEATFVHVRPGGVNWSRDGSKLYALGDGLLDVAVSPRGLAVTRTRFLRVSNGRLAGSRLYLDDGNVLDIGGPVEWLGRFSDYGNGVGHVEALPNGKTFSLLTHLTPERFADGQTVHAFDPATFAEIDAVTFNGAALFMADQILTWGSEGLVLAGEQGIVIAHGSFAAAGGKPPLPTTLPVVTGGTVDSTAGPLTYELLDIGARDLAADSCRNLYIALSGNSAFLPNSVLRYDFAAHKILDVAAAGSEPLTLAVSSDCSMVYAGLQFSNSVTRLRAPALQFDASVPLGYDGQREGQFAFARSISVAPGQPLTIAVARGLKGSRCDGSDLDAVVFDDRTPRAAVYRPADGSGVKSVAWGKDASTLYGEDDKGALAFRVDASGLHDATLVHPYKHETFLDNIGRDLYFDTARGRLLDAFGRVYDANAGLIVGPIDTEVNEALIQCGTSEGTRVTDTTTGKIFFVSMDGEAGESIIKVAAYDPVTFARVGLAKLRSNGIGFPASLPLRVVRPSNDSLAVVTDWGQVFILRGPLLAP